MSKKKAAKGKVAEVTHPPNEGKNEAKVGLVGNAVELVPPPNRGKSEAKGALGGGRSNGSEASDLTRPHPNPPPLGEEASVHTSFALLVFAKTVFDWIWGKAWQLVAGGGLVVFIIGVVGWKNYNKQYEDKLQQGQDLLNVGLYPQAKAAYQQAIGLHPLRHVMLLGKFFGDTTDAAAQQIPDLLGKDQKAQWGLKIASVFDSADPQQIESTLQQLAKDKPKDADINTPLGKFHTFLAVQTQSMDFSLAEQDYQAELADKVRQHPEALYGLGYIRWLQGNIKEAQQYYQQALDLTQSPHYAISLAGLYAEQKSYAKALKVYEGFILKSPIAALEAALVYRLQGQFRESQEWLNTALALLDDAEAKNKLENQIPWQFKTKTALISLSNMDDKRYYVYVTLAASQFLDDDKPNAKASLAKARRLSEAHTVRIKELIDYDLNRLAEERPTLADKIKAFKVQ
jgi:tetratricopeptide (TPR) repeat protein